MDKRRAIIHWMHESEMADAQLVISGKFESTAINQKNFPSVVLQKGETYAHQTVLDFAP